jgi:hypothetical protein
MASSDLAKTSELIYAMTGDKDRPPLASYRR